MNWDGRKAAVRVAESLAVGALYLVAGRIGLAVPFTHGNVSPFWPAAGIAVGALLVLGRHVWWGIAAGALLVNLFSPIPRVASLVVAIGNTLGPAVAAALLRRRLVPPIQRLSDVLRLILFGCSGTALSALIGASTLSLAGIRSGISLPTSTAIWCFGDLLGVLLIVPLFLNFSDLKLTRPRLAELGLLMACLLVGSELLFDQTSFTGGVFGFFLLPFVLWGALRFSVAGAALSSLVVSTFAVWETAHGDGPFLGYGAWLRDMGSLQIFMAVLTISGLSLAAVIAERTKAEAALAREEKLRRAHEQYRRIIETTNDGVWLLNADFRTTFVNQRMAEMLGFAPEEMLGKHLLDFFFPEEVARKKEDMLRRRRGVAEVMYSRCRRKDGSEVWLLVSTKPVLTENKRFDGVLAMCSDVTLLRKTEETLRRNERLIAAGRLAAAISHEVNNPLEAVVNLLYLLKSEPMSDQARQYVELASREIHRVSAISKRSLGFFRDSGAWVDLSLAELLDDTLSFYEQEFAARGIEVVRDYRNGGMVHGSRGEIQQVFANLIANALDAMDRGGVLTLRVHDAGSPTSPGVSIEVEDTGAGIGSNDLNRIFEPFFTTKQNTGTGLGLWITKEIIEKHGGTIAVRSECQPGEKSGTQFSILLPSAAATHAVA